MAKLVVLTEGLTGRTYELKVDRTTVGRVEDNAFHIAEPSVSSHHAEILLRGSDVIVKDLGSTNGTYVGAARITQPTTVTIGTRIRIGKTILELRK